MDGDETIGDEIIEMLMSIHKLLSSVYDFSPSISLSKGFRVIRIEVEGEFYFFNVSDGVRGGCMMVPIECITIAEADELRKNAAALVDEAVRQFKQVQASEKTNKLYDYTEKSEVVEQFAKARAK
jgi:hypothetical protein